MATIEKRGDSYRITVSAGYDIYGNQIKRRMTWKPQTEMTKRQLEKEVNRQAVLFQERVEHGQYLDGNVKLAEFIDIWFRDYAEKQLKIRTVQGYKGLMPRILTALGHIRLEKLQPQHLMDFYNNLAEEGLRLDTKYKPCEDFKAVIKQAGYTQKELAERCGISENALRQCIRGNMVSKETADKITAVLKQKGLFAPANTQKPLADSTIAKYHRVLSSILTTAVQWQVIPSNPCSRVKPPHVEYKEAPVLDENQLAELINCLNYEPLRFRTAVMFTLYTGMRRGELCALNWSDVDFDKKIVHITKSLLYTPENGVFEDTPKSKQSNRVVNIPSDMVALLKEWKLEQYKERLALGDQWQCSGKIITNDFGGVIFPDSVSAWFRKFIKRHNLPNIHFHTLRHISATMLITGGVDIATVSKRLGHADKTTTLNIYTHAIKSADAAAAELLEDMLKPQKHFKAI